jgi:hypothetical protein
VSVLPDEYLRQLGLRDGLELHREVRRLADRDWFKMLQRLELIGAIVETAQPLINFVGFGLFDIMDH